MKASLRNEPDMGCAPLKRIVQKKFPKVKVISVIHHTSDKRSGSVLVEYQDFDYLVHVEDNIVGAVPLIGPSPR